MPDRSTYEGAGNLFWAPLLCADSRVEIRVGDCMDLLRALPDGSVQCVVTSPPYWGLRDYGVEGQLGLEPTLGEHIETMVEVMAEVHRVLADDGTLWLNYGDCYASTPNGRSAEDTKAAGGDDRTFRDKPFSTVGPIYDPSGGAKGGGARGDNKGNANGVSQGRVVAGGTLKPKDLCMVPNRLAIALQEWGWWVRSEIIWAKPNPMPESITDRPATAHEKVWLLSKSARYFYDREAVRTRRNSVGDHKTPDGWDTGPCTHGLIHRSGRQKGESAAEKRDKQRGHSRRHDGFNDRWDAMPRAEQQANGRNLRNYEPAPVEVWNIATRPFSEAHFATFPPELAERCILAGCPKGGLVLDPFGGAGTTGLVAARHNRRALLFELNPEYAEIAANRIRAEWREPTGRQSDDLGPLFSGAGA